MDAVFEQPEDTDKYWADDKQRTAEVLQADKQWMIAARHGDVDRQWFDDRLQDRDARTTDRQTDRYWTESRHPDRHMDRQWTVDRHTQRQIDRKIERQWMGGRQIERSWSENKPADMQVDNQWNESRHQGRKTDRQVQALQLAQRPLPPYPSDRTPSPKHETDPLKSIEASAIEWHPQDTQGDRHACPDAGGVFSEGWKMSGGGGGGGFSVSRATSKPDPPPQSSKPNLSKLRQRHRLESSDALPGNTQVNRVHLLQVKKLVLACKEFLPQSLLQVYMPLTSLLSIATEEEEDIEEDPGNMEKKEKEKRRDSEGHPPPIPEKV